MDFKEQIKKSAILNYEKITNKEESIEALEKYKLMQKDGTLEKYHEQLKSILLDATQGMDVKYAIFKQAILNNVYENENKFVVILSDGANNGSIVLDYTVPNKLININAIYSRVHFGSFDEWTDSNKMFNVVLNLEEIDTWDAFDAIKGYIDANGQLRVSGKIGYWDEKWIKKLLNKLKKDENIEADYDGQKIIFNIK